MKSILAFIDKLLDEEPFTLMTNGIEDEHYTVDADEVVTIADQPRWEQEVQPYNSSRPSDIVKTFKSSTPYVDEGNEKIAENAEFAVIDPTLPLSSDAFDQSWSTIQQAANDAYNKYMVGQLDMDGYEDAIEQLSGQGLERSSRSSPPRTQRRSDVSGMQAQSIGPGAVSAA